MRSEGYCSVCVSVCTCFNSLLDFPQTIPSTARVMTISLIEPFFLNMLRCRDLSAATIVCIQTVGHFFLAENAHAHYFYHVAEVTFFEEEDVLKFRELNLRWLSCLQARFAHNVKLVYHSS